MIELDSKAKIKQIDLKAYLEQFVTFKNRCSSQHGGGYSGPCPICGGNDRFMVYPALGICHCRQCSPSTKWEDIIAFTSRMSGTGFHQTCEFLLKVAEGLPTIELLPSELSAPDPSDEWRRAGEEVVRQCIETLWAPEGSPAREYLHKRFFTDETLKHWSIGASMKWQVIEGLNVPPGIIIPWYFEGALWHLKVRVNERREGTKYKAVVWRDKDRKDSCGVPVLYGADTLQGHQKAVICEGEFDAMLLHQEAGDLIGTITPGNCSHNINARAIPYLLPINPLYVAYDLDDNEAGQKGAEALEKTSDRICIVNVLWGNDITDFKKTGGDLRQWVESFTTDLPELDIDLPNASKGEQPDPLIPFPTAQKARKMAIHEVYRQYRDGVYPWAKEHHPDSIRQQDTLWQAMDAAAEADDEPGTRQAGAALVTLWQDLKEEYAAVFGPADPVHQDGFLPDELDADPSAAPAEVTAPLGEWNRRVMKRDSVKVSKSASGSIICELI